MSFILRPQYLEVGFAFVPTSARHELSYYADFWDVALFGHAGLANSLPIAGFHSFLLGASVHNKSIMQLRW